ncbi:hypothetical protein LCGC14_2239630, partial [marine sediment metagenome]
MAEGRSHQKKRKSKVRTIYNPKAIQRMHQAWELYTLGYSTHAISVKLNCHWHTADKDIQRAQEMCDAGHLRRAEDAREAAIRTRRGVQQLALEDREVAEPKDRAQLLRVVLDGQKGIEDLEGLHQEAPLVQVGPAVYQIAGGPLQPLTELTDDELEVADAHLGSELAALPPAPDDAEEPATE